MLQAAVLMVAMNVLLTVLLAVSIAVLLTVLLEQEQEDWAKRGSVLHNKRMGVVLLIEECMQMLENVDLRCAADNAVSMHELREGRSRERCTRTDCILAVQINPRSISSCVLREVRCTCCCVPGTS